MSKKSSPKTNQESKFLQPGGPGKKELKTQKPSRVSTHKHRSEWFQDRAAWPFREPPIQKLESERRRAKRTARVPGKTKWQSVGPSNIGGRVTCITVHPDNEDDIIIGAAGGGLWRSKDAGINWKYLWHKRDLNIGSLARDPSRPNTIYCGTGEANLSADSYPGIGLYRSTNNGRSWKRRATSKKTGIPTRIGTIAVNPFNRRHILLGGVSSRDSYSAGLFVSKNMGKTWKRHDFISSNNYWCHSIVFHPQRVGVVFATITERGWKNGIWRSMDGGKNWEQLTTGLPDSSLMDFSRTTLAIAPSQPDTIYAIAARGFSSVLGIFRSDDVGLSWKNIAGNHFNNERQMSYNNTIAVHPTNPDFVICGGVDLHVTKNGGDSWSKVTQWSARPGTSRYAHADHHALVMPASAPGLIYDGNDGGLDVSVNNSSSWENRSNGLAITMYYDLDVAPSNSDYLGGGAQDNGTLITVSGGRDDHFELLGGDGGWMNFHPQNENHIYASYQFFHIYRIVGTSYTNISPPASEQERNSVWMAFTALNTDNPDELFTGSRRVWRTRNQGDNWTPVSDVLDNSAISSIEIASAATNQIYVGTTNGGFFRSLDGGDSWSVNLSSAELPGKIITRIESSPEDPDVLYATVGGFNNSHLFKSKDGGLSWVDIDKGRLPDVPHNAVVVQSDDPKRVYVANDLGVFASRNRGKSWRRLTRNLPNVPVVDLVYHEADGILFAATYGRSIWRIEIR